MKKFLTVIVALIMTLAAGAALCACSPSADLGVVQLKYYDNEDEETGYDNNLFYRNDLKETGADPHAIYVTEGEYAGNFFLYATTDTAKCLAYACWKSKDLVNWEYVSTCFTPESDSWGLSSLWAPGVIYDETDGKYYMFYCANNSNTAGGYYECKYIGMAYSDSPAGPFVQYTGTNSDGTEINIGDPIFDFERGKDNKYYKAATSFIDPFPYIDPVTNDKYLYMVRSRNVHNTNVISGVRMKDWATPDYSTYVELTKMGYTTVDGDEVTERPEYLINEAPAVIYNEGVYYLTFSINATTMPEYAVMQAVGDSPLGPFTKVQESDGGLVLGIDMEPMWDHVLCCGSHNFVYDGEDLWIVYHQDRNRASEGESGIGTNNRGFACDRVEWVTNDKGQKLLKAVGPTNSVQPLPTSVTGLKNMARYAEVNATNTVEGSRASRLNDGLIRLHSKDCFDDFYATGTVTITLSFEDYVSARALLIYNSYSVDYAFYQIARIDFGFRQYIDGKEYTGVARAEKLAYDWDKYTNDNAIMRPAAPLILEFDELEINSVTITLTCPQGQEKVGISEIVLLGKELNA